MGCGVAAVLLHTVGDKARIVISLMGDLLFLGAAWLGYGPGVLVLALIIFLVPRILVPSQPSHVELGQFALLTIISLLVSRISSSKRQTEASLRRWGDELERRVEERTLELRRNEQSRAWLAAMVNRRTTPLSARRSMARSRVGIGGQKPSTDMDRTKWWVGPSRLLCPPNAPTTSTILSRVRKGDVVQHYETLRLHKDGRRIVVSVTVSPSGDSDGVIQGASTIARDMTAQRRAQQALEDSEHRYRLLFDNNPQPMWVLSRTHWHSLRSTVPPSTVMATHERNSSG